MDYDFLFELSDQFCKVAAKPKLKAKFPFTVFDDGIIVNGDCLSEEVLQFIKDYLNGKKIACFLFDPPYGKIVSDKWDKTKLSQEQFVEWMWDWTKFWWPLLQDRGAYWMFGGTGVYKFHPFFLYLIQAEHRKDMDMYLADYVSWAKVRSYGSAKRMLYLREELAYFLKSDKNDPRVFNVPYLSEKRPYAGFNKDYPALSEYYRRGNIWKDIKELFGGKYHSCQKPIRLMEIPIEINTKRNEWVLDIFAGSGATGFAARNLGRKFILIEKDPQNYKNIVSRMKKFNPGDKL